jgi:phosphoribosylanthranilate isomerase
LTKQVPVKKIRDSLSKFDKVTIEVCLLQLHGNNREKNIENFDENTYPWNVHIAIRQERKEESYLLPFETG